MNIGACGAFVHGLEDEFSGTNVNLSELNEPEHDKTNKMTSEPSKDSDQPKFSLCALCVGKDPNLLQMDSENWSDWASA